MQDPDPNAFSGGGFGLGVHNLPHDWEGKKRGFLDDGTYREASYPNGASNYRVRPLSQPFLELSLPFLDRPLPFLELSLPFLDRPLPFLDFPLPFLDRPLPFLDLSIPPRPPPPTRSELLQGFLVQHRVFG